MGVKSKSLTKQINRYLFFIYYWMQTKVNTKKGLRNSLVKVQYKRNQESVEILCNYKGIKRLIRTDIISSFLLKRSVVFG